MDKIGSGDLEALKRRNKSLVLSIIHRQGPISRAELTRLTQLSKVTITRLVKELLEEEVVRETGLDISSGGRRPILLELHPESGFTIGVDVGLESIRAGITDLKGNILMGVKRKNEVSQTREELVQKIKGVVDELLEKSDIRTDIRLDKIRGIGVSIPGLIDAEKGVILFGHVVDEKNIPLRDLLRKHFTYPISIDNDANVGVLGERYLGVGRDVKNILYLHIKRYAEDRMSLGCSFVLDGRIYRGASQTSGELGLRLSDRKLIEGLREEDWINFKPWEIDPPIPEQAVEKIVSGAQSLLKKMVKDNLAAITTDTVIEAARKNDRVSLEVLQEVARKLGVRIAFLVNFMNPELVILGGDLVHAENLLLDPIREVVGHLAFEVPAQTVTIKLSELRGEFGGCVGASFLVLSNLFTPTGLFA
ncbi:MAG: ROK family transcriptional regulator [Candidatus Omnitrophica bacterium]|nr:ROK family transcriptional regulator [Candidatus Omnitrophota bacterium]